MSEQNEDQSRARMLQLLFTLGRSYLDRHQNEEALQKFSQLLELEPEHQEACFYSAIAAIRLNAVTDEALALYEQALAIAPDSEQLTSSLAELFEANGIDTPFALSVAERYAEHNAATLDHADGEHASLSGPDHDGAETLVAESPAGQENVLRLELEQLWWQQDFAQAKELVETKQRALGNDSDHALDLELALTHAYESMACKKPVRNKNIIGLLSNVLDELLPADTMEGVRDYLTLRMVMPKHLTQKPAFMTAPDCREYKFILGMVPMDEFFGSIQAEPNGGAEPSVNGKGNGQADHFQLQEIIDEVLDGVNGETELAELAPDDWRSYLFVEIRPRSGQSLSGRLTGIVGSHLANVANSQLRKAGNGFVSFAPDPALHAESALRLMQSLDLYNTALPESERIELHCALYAFESPQDMSSKKSLRNLVRACHLLRAAQGAENDDNLGTFLIACPEKISARIQASGVPLLPSTQTEVLPGEFEACALAFWTLPLEEACASKTVVLGDVELQECLRAQLGYATYRGKHRQLDRPVIVRALSYQNSIDIMSDEKHLDDYYSQIRLIGRMTHPGIATLFDMGEQDQTLYYAREFVEGENILAVNYDDPQWEYELVNNLLKVLGALKYIEAQGTAHLNLKPSNIWLNDSHGCKITDLRIRGFASSNSGENMDWQYSAPELLDSKKGDIRSDTYSLAVIAYEILARTHPYTAVDINSEADLKQANFETLNESGDDFNANWSAWVMKAMALNPKQRFQTVAEAELEFRNVQVGVLTATTVGDE